MSKNLRIGLLKPIKELLDLEVGDEVLFVQNDEGEIVLRKNE